jgi:hypothetical protein
LLVLGPELGLDQQAFAGMLETDLGIVFDIP